MIFKSGSHSRRLRGLMPKRILKPFKKEEKT